MENGKNETMDKKEIIVEIKSTYGKTYVYPVCEIAKTFADIAGTKTLLPNVVSGIKKLGYGIKVKTPEMS